jgi:hypothetical protein
VVYPILLSSRFTSDTRPADWRVHGGGIGAVENQNNLYNILNIAPSLDTGVIVLQHDIYVETVDIAIGATIPHALSVNPSFNVRTYLLAPLCFLATCFVPSVISTLLCTLENLTSPFVHSTNPFKFVKITAASGMHTLKRATQSRQSRNSVARSRKATAHRLARPV